MTSKISCDILSWSSLVNFSLKCSSNDIGSPIYTITLLKSLYLDIIDTGTTLDLLFIVNTERPALALPKRISLYSSTLWKYA